MSSLPRMRKDVIHTSRSGHRLRTRFVLSESELIGFSVLS